MSLLGSGVVPPTLYTALAFPVDFERLGQLVDYYGLLKSLVSQIGVMPRQWWFFFVRPAYG